MGSSLCSNAQQCNLQHTAHSSSGEKHQQLLSGKVKHSTQVRNVVSRTVEYLYCCFCYTPQ